MWPVPSSGPRTGGCQCDMRYLTQNVRPWRSRSHSFLAPLSLPAA